MTGAYRVIGVHHQGVVPVPNVPPYDPRVEPRHVHPGRGGLVTACVISPYQQIDMLIRLLLIPY